MTTADKILHYFRDINEVYNDCRKYDILKSALDAYKEEIMKLVYKIEPILFHLRHIKRMCIENGDCTGCPFNQADKYSDRSCICMFAGDDIEAGVIPADWDLEKLEKEAIDNG